jgi:bisphosphoglycerate-independent phosphoglycerate mutase (AlkP superfamily)
MDYDRACKVLRAYDRFLATLVRFCEAAGITIVITSEHDNIEVMSDRGHTRNPVPFIAFGPRAVEIRERVSTLKDVTPSLLAAYDKEDDNGL